MSSSYKLPLLTAAMQKASEEAAILQGDSAQAMIERIARQIAKEAEKMLTSHPKGRILTICGKGNCGADAIAAARFLRGRGYAVDIWLLYKPELCSAENRKQLDLALCEGIVLYTDAEVPQLQSCDQSYDRGYYALLIDGIYGIHFRPPMDEIAAKACRAINQSRIPVLAIDLPSGVVCDSGSVDPDAVCAQVTLTVAAPKPGLYLYPGAQYAGDIRVADLSIHILPSKGHPIFVRSGMEPLPPLPRRSHKGSAGRVCVVGGSVSMAGAAYFSALAAYRCGCGLVDLISPEENRIILQTLLPEAIFHPYTGSAENLDEIRETVDRCDALVLGPGLSQSASSKMLLEAILFRGKAPLVLDADALNILAKEISLLKRAAAMRSVVVTPHPGEMARLRGESIQNIVADPRKFCEAFAKELGVVCLLKDAHTVISDGRETVINLSGSPALSTGGSGDCLAGILGAFLAFGMSPLDAASKGAYLHGLSGELAGRTLGERSVLARDILMHISDALQMLA